MENKIEDINDRVSITLNLLHNTWWALTGHKKVNINKDMCYTEKTLKHK